MRLARVSVDILRPIPVADLDVSARVRRPGRRVELVTAELSVAAEPVMQMTAWRVAVSDAEVPAVPEADTPPPLPVAAEPLRWPGAHADGYLSAVDWLPVRGAPGILGPAQVWARPLATLIEGEPLSGIQRCLLLADSGSGVSASLDIRRWSFVNVDLTVLLHRHPGGEWICLQSSTVIDGDGMGMAETALSDQRGRVGRALQTLVVSGR
jgi:Thioesterase-like superfamily